MTTRTWMAAVCRWLIVLLALGLGVPGRALAERRVALLVGVSAYASPLVPALDGPVHDVAALRDVLVRRWGFRGEDIVTLTDAQATRARVLAEIDALARRSGAGDEVLIYFSGHGTSALDLATGELVVPHGSGALVTHDHDPRAAGGDSRGLVVGRTDLVPRLTALERGRRVWVVMDMCFSGQAVRRSLSRGSDQDMAGARTLTLSRANTAERMTRTPADRAAPPPYPYRATAFLSAAAEGELAQDVSKARLPRWPTLDGRPHGALTDALLRVLEGQVAGDLNGDGWLDLNEVHRAVGDFMAQRSYGQAPQRLPAVAEDLQGLGARPVLAVREAAARPRQAPPAALSVYTEDLSPTLVQRLGGLPDVRLVRALPADLEVVRVGDQVSVIDASGDRLLMLPAPDADRLVGQVRQRAWVRRLRVLAQRHQRGVLPMAIEPAAFGGNFAVGERLSVMVRPDRRAWLVLVNIGADGQAELMHPTAEHERVALPGNQLVQVPPASSPLSAALPEGKDIQFAFAFDQEPARALTRVERLEQLVVEQSGRFTFGETEYRTWARRP